MKVSIITACYNSSKTILDSIFSVNNQTYNDIEHLIIDGSSTDNTIELIKSVENRVVRIVSERDKGIYDAMNKGISCASGEIIGILNSDDLYFDNKVIQKIVDIFLENKDVDIVYGDLVYVKQNNINSVVRLWQSSVYYENFFEDGYVPPHPSVFVRTHVYEKAGLFNLKFRLAADYEFLLRVFKKHRFKSQYLPSVFVKMRYGGATNKSIINIIEQNNEIFRAWRTNGFKVPSTFLLRKIFKRLVQFLK